MKILDVTRPVISNMTVWLNDKGALLEHTMHIREAWSMFQGTYGRS